MIGKGGFGEVYLGTLQSGERVAVKKLSLSSNQGYKEFKSEVRCNNRLVLFLFFFPFLNLHNKYFSLSQDINIKKMQAKFLTLVHHRNVVSLVGYCDEGDAKALIYEYLSKGNLQEQLSGLLSYIFFMITW